MRWEESTELPGHVVISCPRLSEAMRAAQRVRRGKKAEVRRYPAFGLARVVPHLHVGDGGTKRMRKMLGL